MKKRFLFLSMLGALALVACGGKSVPASSSAPASDTSASSESSLVPSSESSSEELSTSVSESVSESASEQSEESSPSASSDRPAWVDYAHDGTVKLGLDYVGRNFFADGLEKVSLFNTIDGDTAHFKNANDETIKARFFGIDTPESTGKIQDYGKAASNYTKGILQEADKNGTIVISSAQHEYGVPNPDSTGSRYVCLIWVNTEKKDAGLDELYLLNLMIVQEGLSWMKTVTDMPEYVDTFYAAESQAKAYKLYIHSGVPDPDRPTGDYEMVSLLDLKNAMLEELEEHKKGNKDFVNRYHNKNVRVQGTVNGFANHIIYLADFCFYLDDDGNPIDDSAYEIGVNGEYASINIFAGMSAPSSKFTTLGNYIEVCGTAIDSQFGFQITNVELPSTPYSDKDGRLILKASANTEEHALHVFDYTADELQAAMDNEDYNALNCRINMTTPIQCTRAYQGDSGDITLYFARPYNFRCYFTFKFKPYPVDKPQVTWATPDYFVDKTFTVSGVYAYHESAQGNISMQICPSVSADLVLVEVPE